MQPSSTNYIYQSAEFPVVCLFTSFDGVSGGNPEVVDDVWYLLCFQSSRHRERVDVTGMAHLWRDLLVRA
jgi:hypothetical protein